MIREVSVVVPVPVKIGQICIEERAYRQLLDRNLIQHNCIVMGSSRAVDDPKWSPNDQQLKEAVEKLLLQRCVQKGVDEYNNQQRAEKPHVGQDVTYNLHAQQSPKSRLVHIEPQARIKREREQPDSSKTWELMRKLKHNLALATENMRRWEQQRRSGRDSGNIGSQELPQQIRQQPGSESNSPELSYQSPSIKQNEDYAIDPVTQGNFQGDKQRPASSQSQSSELHRQEIHRQDSCDALDFLDKYSNKSSHFAVGKALHQIREERLYCRVANCQTFKEYVENSRRKFGFGYKQALRLIEFYRFVLRIPPHLCQVGDKHFLPTHERQIREIRGCGVIGVDIWVAAVKYIRENSIDQISSKLINTIKQQMISPAAT